MTPVLHACSRGVGSTAARRYTIPTKPESLV
jgi:hypothetical protein